MIKEKGLEKIILDDVDFIEQIEGGIEMYKSMIIQLTDLYNKYEMDKEHYIVTPYTTDEGALSYDRIRKKKIGY